MVLALLAMLSLSATGQPMTDQAAPASVRVAVFNIWELTSTKIDAVDDQGAGANPQLRGAAEIIQRHQPDILLVNEIDFDAQRSLALEFQKRYLRVPQNGQKPIEFPHVYYQPVNTGVPTGKDLDNDGRSDGPGDAQGYGKYPGQYGMALFSRYPINADAARTFQNLLWKDVPGNLMPDGADGRPAWYDADEAAIQRLSSKSHWDIPVRVSDVTLHLLCAHPTPPVFDGDEDRNGRRNYDEIRLWVDYLTGGKPAEYIVDDQGRRGPLPDGAAFVLLGDLNADPARAPADYGPPAIRRLLELPTVLDPAPTSAGAAGENPPGAPDFPERKTCDFGRLDYVLCARNLHVTGSGVFWPAIGDPLHQLVSDQTHSSDHRLVWVDIALGKPKE